MIKRIVHGQPEDPNSTRDITGLTPFHLELLVNLLMGAAQTLVAAREMNLQQFKEQFAPIIQGLNESQIETTYKAMSAQSEFVLEILEAINQPYNGQIYERENGKVLMQDGKEIPLGKTAMA